MINGTLKEVRIQQLYTIVFLFTSTFVLIFLFNPCFVKNTIKSEFFSNAYNPNHSTTDYLTPKSPDSIFFVGHFFYKETNISLVHNFLSEPFLQKGFLGSFQYIIDHNISVQQALGFPIYNYPSPSFQKENTRSCRFIIEGCKYFLAHTLAPWCILTSDSSLFNYNNNLVHFTLNPMKKSVLILNCESQQYFSDDNDESNIFQSPPAVNIIFSRKFAQCLIGESETFLHQCTDENNWVNLLKNIALKYQAQIITTPTIINVSLSRDDFQSIKSHKISKKCSLYNSFQCHSFSFPLIHSTIIKFNISEEISLEEIIQNNITMEKSILSEQQPRFCF